MPIQDDFPDLIVFQDFEKVLLTNFIQLLLLGLIDVILDNILEGITLNVAQFLFHVRNHVL